MLEKIINDKNDMGRFTGIKNLCNKRQEVCELFERAFLMHRFCKFCHSKQVNIHGYSAGLRRFRCKDCGKTFNVLTKTALARLRKKELWLSNADCLLNSETIRNVAHRLDVDPKTAFLWRHRMLKTAHDHEDQYFDEDVELDEGFFRMSQKGNRHLTRPPRKRGTFNIKEFPIKQLVCVLYVKGHDLKEADYITGWGRVKLDWLQSHFASHLGKSLQLAVERPFQFYGFCRSHDLELNFANDGEPQPNVLYPQIEGVRAYRWRVQKWLEKFKGVATKNLYHYLGWAHELFVKKIKTAQRLLMIASSEHQPHLTGT